MQLNQNDEFSLYVEFYMDNRISNDKKSTQAMFKIQLTIHFQEKSC